MTAALDLERARAFVIDVDGCLVLSDGPGGSAGGRAIPGAPELVAHLKDSGVAVLCCTNGSSSLPAEYAAGLREKGIAVADHEVLTPAVAGARYIEHHYPDGLVLPVGGHALTAALTDRGIRLTSANAEEPPDVVIVGHKHSISRDELQRAGLAVLEGAAFLVTATAPWFAARSGRSIGMAAAIAGCIRAVTGREPTIVGKPSSILMEAAHELLGVPYSEMVVVGDDVVAEVGMGRAHGAQTVLVLSGVTSTERAASAPPEQRADLTVNDIGALLAQVTGSQAGRRRVG